MILYLNKDELNNFFYSKLFRIKLSQKKIHHIIAIPIIIILDYTYILKLKYFKL